MLKAWNRRVRMTTATTNAVAIVRMVSDNAPCRRFSSLDTVIGREGSGWPLGCLAHGSSVSIVSFLSALNPVSGEADAGDRRVRFGERGWEAAVAAWPHPRRWLDDVWWSG